MQDNSVIELKKNKSGEIVISNNRERAATHVYGKGGGALIGAMPQSAVAKYLGKTGVYTLKESEGKRLLFEIIFLPLSIGTTAKEKFEHLRELLEWY